jgi:uncharacterized protein (TIGR02246 family)
MRALLLALLTLAAPAAAQRNEAADRAAIHKLLTDYGATLDRGDFDGFGRLFGKSGVYVTGGAEAKGPQAAETMRKVFTSNAMGLPEPRYHIFFNEVVAFDGPDRAHASSMSFYVAPDEKNRPAPVLMAAYDDQLVREDGHWVFARRVIRSLIPAPKKPN